MTTELMTTETISPATLEAVVVGGDLSKLTPGQRLEWYSSRCNAAGLDPRTQPFQYITLNGKLTLYATKTATDQLIAQRRLTVQITDRKHIEALDLYEVQVRVTFPDGHTVEDMAAVNLAGLKGEALANATMKAVTKAKRRTVLSACGLGMLDESEAETIPQAIIPKVDYTTGELLIEDDSITEAERKALFGAAKSAGWSQDHLKDYLANRYGVTSTTMLVRGNYDEIMTMLSKQAILA